MIPFAMNAPAGGFVEETTAGPILLVRVTPRARRLGVEAGAGRLAVRVGAPAERGRATEEALGRIADFLDLPRSALSLASGATSRDKRVRVAGFTPSDLRKRIAERLGRPS